MTVEADFEGPAQIRKCRCGAEFWVMRSALQDRRQAVAWIRKQAAAAALLRIDDEGMRGAVIALEEVADALERREDEPKEEE